MESLGEGCELKMNVRVIWSRFSPLTYYHLQPVILWCSGAPAFMSCVVIVIAASRSFSIHVSLPRPGGSKSKCTRESIDGLGYVRLCCVTSTHVTLGKMPSRVPLLWNSTRDYTQVKQGILAPDFQFQSQSSPQGCRFWNFLRASDT